MVTIPLVGEFGKDVTLEGVKEMLAKVPAGEGVNVVLDSIGGDLLEADRIATELLKYEPIMVTVKKAASAATVPFFKITDRVLHPDADEAPVMVHNTSWVPTKEGAYSAEELEEHVRVMRDVDSILANMYSQYLGISQQEAKDMMALETYLAGDKLKDFGIVAKAVIQKQTANPEVMSIFKSLLDRLSNIDSKLQAMEEPPKVEVEVEAPEVETPEQEVETIESLKAKMSKLQAECDQYKAMADKYNAEKVESEKSVSELSERIMNIEAKLQAVQTPKPNLHTMNATPANANPYPKGDHRHTLFAKTMGVFTSFVLALLVSFGALAQVQNTEPRWGTAASGGNIVPSKFGGQTVFAVAAGIDTVTISPQASNWIVRCAASQSGANVALSDSVAFRFTPAARRQWYIGDEVTFLLTADGSARKVKFIGSASAATQTITASKHYSVTLVFNGSVWVAKAAGVVAP